MKRTKGELVEPVPQVFYWSSHWLPTYGL